MTIAYVGENTIYSETGDSSPATLTYPTTSAGEKLLLFIETGNDTNGTVSTPTDWELVGTVVSTSGTWGAGDGPRRLTVFEKNATGSETGTFDVTWTSTGGAALFLGQIHRFSKTAGAWATTAFVSGVDTSSGSGAGTFSVTTGSLALAPGDMAAAFLGGNSDSVFLGPPTIAASGITFGTVTEHEAGAVGGGYRGCVDIASAVVSSGTATGAVTVTVDVAADPITGAGMVVRLREAAGGDTALASSATVQTTATAAVSTSIRAVAAASAVSTLTAAATTQIRLATSASSQATVTASLSTQVRLAAACAGVCTSAAALSTQVRLASSMTTTSTLSAGLSAGIRFAAALVAQATGVATLAPDYRNYALLGNFDSWRLKARAAGADAASSTVAAAAVANTTVSASLTTGVRFAAAVAVTSTLTPALSTGIRLAAGVQALATGSAQLTTGIRPIAGVQVAVSVTAILTGTSAPMEINAQGQVNVTASLTTAVRLAAVAIAQAQASAQFTTGLALVAAAQSRVAIAANLDNVPVFTVNGTKRIGQRRVIMKKQRIG